MKKKPHRLTGGVKKTPHRRAGRVKKKPYHRAGGVTKPPQPRTKSVAVIGTGLIGTSIAMALRRRDGKGARTTHARITGWDPSKAARTAASARRAFTTFAGSLEEAIRNADLVVVAAPLDEVVVLLPRVIAAAKSGALVLDVAGLKAPVIAAAGRALRKRPDVEFVSGHPMAGRERSGAAHADSKLFAGRPFALVAPTQPLRASALRKAQQFARSLGAKPISLTPKEHDRLVAATSALPQLSAVALALAVEAASKGGARKLAGPGYADTTRLAESPFHVWRAVLRASKPAVNSALRHLERALSVLVRAARRTDDRELECMFFRAAEVRRRVVSG